MDNLSDFYDTQNSMPVPSFATNASLHRWMRILIDPQPDGFESVGVL